MTAAGGAGEKKNGYGRKIHELEIQYRRTQTRACTVQSCNLKLVTSY